MGQRMMRKGWPWALAGLLVACGGDDTEGTGDGSETDGTSTTSSGPTTDPSTTTDNPPASTTDIDDPTSGGIDGSSSSTGEPADPYCADQGFPVAELLLEGGTEWGDVAGDFTATTTFGSWNLAEDGTGCDSYIFLNDQGSSTASSLRSTLDTEFFTRSARNVHYFFVTTSGDPTAGAEEWQSAVGAALGGLESADQEYWAAHVHFVTDMTGSVVDFLSARPDQPAFGIDRAQTWDDPGSLSDFGGGTFFTTALVLGYTGRYYNARYAQDLELAAQEDVTEVVALDNYAFEPECDGSCSGLPNGPFANSNNWQTWPAEFPDAKTMEGFDTMEVVVTAQCGPSPDADCGHWDYEAMLNLCDDAECTEGASEFARWITPYSRPGSRRWVFEASPLLGMVADGGTHYVQFGMVWNMNPSIWDIRFRLRNTGKDSASREVVPAFVGNRGFNDDYNTWETLDFTPPEGTTKVEFVALISGHGQEGNNCAEWCEHQHEFTVNGTDVHRREFTGEVVPQRCGEAVDDGVVPGQYGNWTPGRAGWCPGAPIEPWIVDITDQVTMGQSNTLDYEGLFANVPVEGGRGRIRLSSYVVYSN